MRYCQRYGNFGVEEFQKEEREEREARNTRNARRTNGGDGKLRTMNRSTNAKRRFKTAYRIRTYDSP